MGAIASLNLSEPHTADELARFCALAGCAPLTPDAVAASHADAHLLLADAAGEPHARCSLWWSATPPHQNQRVGAIGHYAARDTSAARQLLDLACRRLAAHGCTLAVGPMEGSTHRAYRLVTERGTLPPFFLEPDTPADYPAHFVAAGFEPLAEYSSALQTSLEHDEPRTAAIAARLAARGLRIRPLDAGDLDAELRRIHAVVEASFRASPLFTHMPEDAFIAQYRPLVPAIVPELVLLAEHGEQPVGLLFVVPDLLRARQGQPLDTLILKTLAVRPEYAGSGLAGWLIARGLETARALGYTRIIHALMHESNRSRRLSQRFAGQIIRRYALYGRPLESIV